MPRTYIDPKTGETKTVNIAGTVAHEVAHWDRGSSWGDGYYFNNPFRTSNAEDVEVAVQYIMNTGKYDEEGVKQALKKAGRGKGKVENELYEIIEDAKTYINRAGYTIEDIEDTINKRNITSDPDSPQDTALNAYYNDIYSLEEGTSGKAIYDALVQSEQDAALSNMQLADANFQQQAMQQAQTVKTITDQVRAERVARLRAGMSESQIANQDMAMLMSNINALNQQSADASAARLQAQQQYQNAQNTAYQAWLANANTMAQSGAAFGASDAGDIMQQALRYSQATGVPLKKAVDTLSGKQS